MKKLSYVSLMLIACFLLPFSGYSQDNLVRVIQPEDVSWKNEERSQFTKMSSYKGFEKVELVSINDLFSIQKNGIVEFSLDANAKKIQARTFRMEYKSENEYDWFGTTLDGLGSIYISRKGDKYHGYISLPGIAEYQILSFGDQSEKHVLIKLVSSAENSKVCGSDKKSEIANPVNAITDPISNGLKNARIGSCNTFVRVLVLYTPEAVQTTGININDLVYNCVGQFNSSIYRSNITSAAAITTAAILPFSFNLTSSMENDRDTLIINPTAQNLRNQYQADLVVLITQDHPDPSLAGVAGTLTLDNSRSYAVVEVQHAANSKTFAHEVGHLFGCHHRTIQDSGGPQYAHAYRFEAGFFGPYCVTLMEGGIASNKIENFSNPNVSVSGTPTGTSANEDNARRISETWSTVKGFRPEPNVLSAYIDGPTYGYVYNSYTWEAITACGDAPFSYEWRVSSDGFNWSSVRSTGEFFTDNLPWYSSQYYYIWLKVTSADNQQSNAYSTVYIDMSQMGGRISAENTKDLYSLGPISWKNIQVDLQPLTEIDVPLQVFPNPSNKEAQVTFLIKTDDTVLLDVVDLSGRIVRSLLHENKKEGIHHLSFPVKDLAAGEYILRLATSSQTKTAKLLVTQ